MGQIYAVNALRRKILKIRNLNKPPIPQPRDKSIRHIPLTKGRYAIIDSEDYGIISSLNWHASNRRDLWYAGTHVYIDGRYPTLQMHKLLLIVSPGYVTDHINGNGLDNRRANLRQASYSQNKINQGIGLNNTSGRKGVTLRPDTGKWRAQILVNRINVSLGNYDDIEEAYEAYCIAANRYFGEFARLL